jgi:cobalt-precorrin 5A hydrolase
MAKRRMIAVIYLTAAGKSVAECLAAGWDQESLEVIAAGSSLSLQVRSLWDEYESFIFIMAVGIVVRLIAPLLKSKWDDPGVVVVDEGGHFAVSLVGGHWGGSNALTRQVAALLGAVPVITTATDVQGKPALDTLAKQWGMLPMPRERVKEANKAFLAGERVVIYTEWDLQLADEKGIEVLPLARHTEHQSGFPVYVTSREYSQFSSQGVCLCPPCLSAGIGCKRGVSAEEILGALEEALKRSGRNRDGLAVLASHEIKGDEAGLREAAARWKLPLIFYSTDVLRKIHEQHPYLADSNFVRERTGVGGVCETAALAAAAEGKLVLSKMKIGRVTVALAEAGLLWSESGQAIRRI